MSRKSDKFDAAKAWFDLEKYLPLEHLTLREWGEQIVKRAFLLKSLDELQKQGTDSPWYEIGMDQIAEQIERLKMDPLGKWFSNSGEPPLRQMSLADMDGIVSSLSRYNQIAQELGQCTLAKDIPLDSAMGSEGNFLGHIRINLAARDTDIRIAFNTWLEQRRQRFNFDLAKKAIRKDAIERWLGAGVIPFTDLSIWERFIGFKLTEEQRIDLIFPEKECDYRDQHRTTRDEFAKYMTLANGYSLVFGQDD